MKARHKDSDILAFLVQEKQAGLVQKMSQPVQTPEGVPRLFDLVTVRDEKLQLAFYSQLGNTVVAKNLDQVCSASLITTVGSMFVEAV
jgi:structural maintenance of chromosome 4